MTRPAPGELYYRCPDCAICGKETDADGDSFRCYACRCHWSMRGGDDGEWDDPSEPICPKILTHEAIPVFSGRCLLGEGHKGEHSNGNTTWDAKTLPYRRGATETDADDDATAATERTA